MAERMPMIDALKAVGALLIVVHHLAFYGPMSDVAYPLAPALIDWLYDKARIAVQMFLVVGGFLAARGLAPDGRPKPIALPQAIAKRYVRLVVPYAVALIVGMLCVAVVRPVFDHDSLGSVPTVSQFLAHLALLHGVLGIESLQAGVWYVAIDFQLFVIIAVLAWLVGRSGVTQVWLLSALLPALVAALTLASLLWFNLDDSLDHLGLYFFGAYGLGALAWWASRSTRPWLATLAVLAIGAIALVAEYRLRIAVTLAVAVLLSVAAQTGWLQRLPVGSGVQRLGQMSYSLFLIHFPISLVVSAVVTNLWPAMPWWQVAGMLTSVLLSVVAGWLLYHGVERRLG